MSKSKAKPILSNLETSTAVTSSSKFFFSETTDVPAPKRGSRSSTGLNFKPSSIAIPDQDIGKQLIPDNIFDFSSESKHESKGNVGTNTLGIDSNPSIAKTNEIKVMPSTVSAVSEDNDGTYPKTMTVAEAENYLAQHDIEKIFENYNSRVAQLLSNSFDIISTSYDKALQLNCEMKEFNEKVQQELVHLGKRKRDSSEAVEILRNRIKTFAPSHTDPQPLIIDQNHPSAQSE